MCSTLSSCRLYSWMRLIWLSKIESGSTAAPASLEPVGESHLGVALGLANALAERRVVGQRLRASRAGKSVIQPSPIASVMSAGQAGFASSSQRRGVTPLVLLLKRSGNISAKSLTASAQQFRVDRGDAVGAVRADDRQIRHADLPVGAFLDQADARRPGLRRPGIGSRTSSRKRRLIS